MRVVLVPTTHWDREWYRTFQVFRARLVDTVDKVLELLDTDDGYTFLLDGQSIVLEDYLAIRPERRGDLERAIRAGRVEIGPWYVQPDSLLPSGEAHVRNLLEGRRVAETFGACSEIAYTPDSFGHPSQFPQLFAGFGLRAFVYWRGNAGEIIELPAEYAWVAPDGTPILACHLWEGYFSAAGLPDDPDRMREVLVQRARSLADRTTGERILMLAGVDHQLPETRTHEACETLAEATGWTVGRGLLGDFVGDMTPDGRPTFAGELVGGRVANLLPGVWSTRTSLKLRNRESETALDGWAEPWAAFGMLLGTPDERPALRLAWRELLRNQAHDSICGCSQDAVHEQMLARYDAATELARETSRRACERIAGLGADRRLPWSDEIQIAVFNPSPHPRTDVVRFALDTHPPFRGSGTETHIHPLLWANLAPKGFTVDGQPARVVPTTGTDRVRLVPAQQDHSVEFVATDVPAFGYRVFALAPSEHIPDAEDDGRTISNDVVAVTAADDGTFTIERGSRTFTSLGGLEDIGDRGDTYDHDPVPTQPRVAVASIRRSVAVNAIQHLYIDRTVQVPSIEDGEPDAPCRVVTVVRVVPGVDRVDIGVRVENDALNHRLRMRFPSGAPAPTFTSQTTFDAIERSTGPIDASGWNHAAHTTICQQGWVRAGDLTVGAPGLYEAEVTPDGDILITVLRAVGWLSRPDLNTRPEPAGPSLPTPGAQCRRPFTAWLSLHVDAGPRAARDAELGLVSVGAGDAPLAPSGRPLLDLRPDALLISAVKPAERDDGVVVRVLNPTDGDLRAELRFGLTITDAVAVRLDETPSGDTIERDGELLSFDVPAHALRSVLLR